MPPRLSPSATCAKHQDLIQNGNPTPPPTPLFLPKTLAITVGTSPNHRIWTLPRSLLQKHSTAISDILASTPFQPTLTLSTTCPRAFANFATYMHSSIYALNELVPHFRAIPHHSAAVLLGVELGCKDYSIAALRKLYAILEGVARLRESSAMLSVIRASDVDLVCGWIEQAEGTAMALDSTEDVTAQWKGDQAQDLKLAFKLREMIIHAMAAQWTRYEIATIGAKMDVPGDTARWLDVYDAYPEFRAGLYNTMAVGDAWRGALLKDVEYYLGNKDKEKGNSENGYETEDEMGGGLVRARSIKQARKTVAGVKKRMGSKKLVKKQREQNEI